MFDLGLFLICQAISRQLAAIPNEFYLIRLIHAVSRKPARGERLWTVQDLARAPVVRSLRDRNDLGFNVYLWPYAEGRNAGYIFLDLDEARPQVLEALFLGSPGHLQAWVRVSTTTTLGRLLAERYGGDRASSDWRHLGRLAGFANRKPTRCCSSSGGYHKPTSRFLNVIGLFNGFIPVIALQMSAFGHWIGSRIGTAPTPADMDSAITLAAILAPGNDISRWKVKEGA